MTEDLAKKARELYKKILRLEYLGNGYFYEHATGRIFRKGKLVADSDEQNQESDLYNQLGLGRYLNQLINGVKTK